MDAAVVVCGKEEGRRRSLGDGETTYSGVASLLLFGSPTRLNCCEKLGPPGLDRDYDTA